MGCMNLIIIIIIISTEFTLTSTKGVTLRVSSQPENLNWTAKYFNHFMHDKGKFKISDVS